MNLPLATLYAQQIVTWLTPFCERIEIAGSIRRQRPIVNDIDLVCIPKIHDSSISGLPPKKTSPPASSCAPAAKNTTSGSPNAHRTRA
jgi:hypothetical protein